MNNCKKKFTYSVFITFSWLASSSFGFVGEIMGEIPWHKQREEHDHLQLFARAHGDPLPAMRCESSGGPLFAFDVPRKVSGKVLYFSLQGLFGWSFMCAVLLVSPRHQHDWYERAAGLLRIPKQAATGRAAVTIPVLLQQFRVRI